MTTEEQWRPVVGFPGYEVKPTGPIPKTVREAFAAAKSRRAAA